MVASVLLFRGAFAGGCLCVVDDDDWDVRDGEFSRELSLELTADESIIDWFDPCDPCDPYVLFSYWYGGLLNGG